MASKVLPFLKDSVKKMDKSVISKSETNDCVVRAMACTTGMTYDESHKFCAEKLERKPRKGVIGFYWKLNRIMSSSGTINNKVFRPLGEKKSTDCYCLDYKNRKGEMTHMTVRAFVSKYPKGLYLVVVRHHAFAIKNGVVMGNADDATRIGREITNAWKVVIHKNFN